jgi:uncharacterized membrane protein SpoIIM required for sporulation
LAYARTFYPESRTTQYLNELATDVYRQIYRNRKEDHGRLVTFWTHEVPEALGAARVELLASGVVFLVAVLVGVVSAAHDADFVRLILGDQYVNFTLEQIEGGDPMAIYKQAHEVDMFLGIAFNNVRVAFMAFAFGLLASVGTAYVLVSNGIMLGAFHYLFFEQGVLGRSLLVVYIHGTLEIAAIVVAGAAGFALGNGLLFPGTYPRRVSFARGAKRGVKIVVGLVPIFIAAALLEGFVTRYTGMPLVLSLGIIGGSLAFVLYYFVARPLRLAARAAEAPSDAVVASRAGPPGANGVSQVT